MTCLLSMCFSNTSYFRVVVGGGGGGGGGGCGGDVGGGGGYVGITVGLVKLV